MQGGTTKSYRLEEIPKDQEELQDNDLLVPVAHFNKEVFSTFGSPFLILLSQGDTVGAVKQKIQDKLGVGFLDVVIPPKDGSRGILSSVTIHYDE